MQIDDALLSRLEKLSFVKIADEKREEIVSQLSQIVNFVDNLSELNTDGVDDKFAMSDVATFLREDVASCDTSVNDAILANAPQSSEHFFIVPKIIE